MLQNLEIMLLYGIAYFYSMLVQLGIVLLWLPAAVLFLVQFKKRKQTFVPGLFGFLFLAAGYFHTFRPEVVINWSRTLLETIQRGAGTERIFLLEPIFAFFVAPASRRFVFEEVLFVLLSAYFFSVVYHSYRSYKRTGRIFDDLSLGAFLTDKYRRPQRSENNELGSGDLEKTEKILQWTRPRADNPHDDPNPHTVLNVKDLKGGEGIALKSGKLYIPRGERNRHMLMVAKTGGGKTTRFILPILYDDILCPHRSTIVIDSKPEMWSKLANLTRKYNPEKEIFLFNPLDVARSLSWNILGKIENDTDCKLIANTIVMATDNPSAKADSPFFRNNALSILNAIMVGLLSDKDETLSMPRIHELVQGGMKSLCDWLEAHPNALRTSRTFVELARSGSQNADTIMSELGMRLAAWDLKAIRSTTWENEFNIADLVEKPSLFIVELRESELEMLRPLANVIVVELLRYLTKYAEKCKGHKLPRPVGFVIDEFASALGRLPDIHVKLNTLRSRNVSIVAAIQSIAQVKANYGDDADSVLAGFSSKIFLPPLDLQDAEWASKETGQMTIRFKTASTGSNKKLTEWFASNNDSIQEQVQQRAVLTPDEIGRPADGAITFFFPNTAPFQGHLVPWYEHSEMSKHIRDSESDPEIQLRDKPIEIVEKLPEGAKPQGSGGAGTGSSSPNYVSNTKGWKEEDIRKKLEEVKTELDWANTTGSAKKWWEAFENENQHRIALVLRLAEELAHRKATITEFFLAYVYSNTDNIQANLHYLDYTRLKKEEERKKKEAAEQAKAQAANA